ncbi:MAG: hypothetical protein ACXVIG_08280 [Halobacteriota archaeon]
MVGCHDRVGEAVGVGCKGGVGVSNDAGLDVGTTEGDGVTVGVADADAVVVIRAVADAVFDVLLAAWLLLVNEVHPAINNEATTTSTVTANHSFLIQVSANKDTELKE